MKSCLPFGNKKTNAMTNIVIKNSDIIRVTFYVNRGGTGLSDREKYTEKTREVLVIKNN